MKHLPILAAILLSTTLSAPLNATENGLPVARTGGFGEQTCAACHRPEPLNTGNQASVSIDVGPYVPGAKQRVIVKVSSAAGNRWGFQLTARLANNTPVSAGTFEAINQFTAVRCTDGRFAPCPGGGVTYVTHTSVGSAPGGQPGFKQFAFDWTPPAADVGAITFAAAGLAADGDRGTNSDITAVTTTTSLYAPSNSPAINTGGVANAAALQREKKTITPGQLISVFGSNLNAPGASASVTVRDFDELGLIPDALARLSVIFKVPGDPREYLGRMIFVNDSQANLQVPNFPTTAGKVTVQPVINREGGNSEVRGAAVEVAVEARAPGLFTFGSTGVGQAAAVNSATGRLVAPAQAGDVILLYGTGFGGTTPPFLPGELADRAAPINGDVTVEIGGIMAEVFYAGAAPNYAGLMQFNVRVPNLPPGEYAVFVRVGTFVTQTNVVITVQ